MKIPVRWLNNNEIKKYISNAKGEVIINLSNSIENFTSDKIDIDGYNIVNERTNEKSVLIIVEKILPLPAPVVVENKSINSLLSISTSLKLFEGKVKLE